MPLPLPALARRSFATTARRLVAPGDRIPRGVPGTFRDSPKHPCDIGALVSSGTSVLLGVPAAFSPTCSDHHVPDYLRRLPDLRARGVDRLVITTVNDPFVTAAWARALRIPQHDPYTALVADTQGNFASAIGALFDATATLGTLRSQRYALVVRDGQVLAAHCEPDKTGLDRSTAQNLLKHL